jgi:glycosyltransferase involved in cell wall biosynthesis
MIIKNEEDNLANCLESVYTYVDEIIVVDTGSKDRSKEISKKYGAKVIEAKWQDNFATARNVSITNATGDWILYLDADEELPSETAKDLKNLTKSNDVTGWLFTIISPIFADIDSPESKHSNIRMFKNKVEYKFNGRVHEQIKPSIMQNKQNIIKDSKLTILHHGYRRDLPGRKKKTLRNIKLLQKDLEEAPHNSFINYNLGISYFMIHNFKKSIEHYQIALENLNKDKNFASILYRNYCICLIEIGEFSQALKLLDKGLTYFNDYPDLYFLKGQIHGNLGLLQKAKKYFYTTTSGRFQEFLECRKSAQ